jgi:hypothetical protein
VHWEWSLLQMKTRPVIDVAQLLWKTRHFSENQPDEREKSYRNGKGPPFATSEK